MAAPRRWRSSIAIAIEPTRGGHAVNWLTARGPKVLELLHPGPELHLPRPRAARLVEHVQVRGGDGVGLEHRLQARGRFAAGARDRAVDHEVLDVDALRRELAGEALREAAQRELRHREGRRLRVALDARRGAGEEDRAEAARQHA